MGARGIVATFTAALALAASVMVAAAPPAAAATAPPWHFATVTGSLTMGAGEPGHGTLTCPGGYTAVSGGFSRPSLGVWRATDYPSYSGTYEWDFLNGDFETRTIDLTAFCVLASDLGTITAKTSNFTRNSSSGYAEGTTTCPSGTLLLSGGIEWSGGGDRKIIESSPVGLNSWFARGFSTVANAYMAIEVRCVDASLMATAQSVRNHFSGTKPGFESATCPSGMRLLTGGGYGWYGYGELEVGSVTLNRDSITVWTTKLEYSDEPVTEAICVPNNHPTVTITSQPAALSDDPTPSFTWTASDPIGEYLTYACYLNSVQVSPCSQGIARTYSALPDGAYFYGVQATNSSGYSSYASAYFEIDTVAPAVSTKTPASQALVADPVSVGFSEVVQGVDASTFTVAPTGGSPLSGTVSTTETAGKTSATWQHSAPFVLGQQYTATLTAGIHDPVGHSLATTTWTFTAVEKTPPTILTKPASSAIGGPVTVGFSEVVSGLSTTSLYLRADGASTNVPATVTGSGTNKATWRPTSPLTPGHWYTAYATGAIHDAYGNALAATSWRVRAGTTVQNDSLAVTERWDVDPSSVASGGSFITSRTAGSAATLTFTATAGQVVSLYGIRLPSGGYGEVWLDGTKRTTATFYGSATARVRLYLSGALTAGTHTLQVRVPGTKPSASSGTWVSVDNVLVGSTTYQEGSLRQAFRRVATASASAGSYDLVEDAKDSSGRPSYAMTFWGTGIMVYATKSPGSGQANVYVDGTLAGTVTLTATTTTYKNLVLTKTLAAGTHTVTVSSVGTTTGSKSSVGLDYLLVT